MIRPRRDVLHLTATALGLSFATGCLGATEPGDAGEAHARTSQSETRSRHSKHGSATPTAEAERTQSPTTSEWPDSVPRDPRTKRGAADPITVERAITDEDVSYVADDDAVRFVARLRAVDPDETEEGETPHREPVYDTIPFEQWGETECASQAAKATAEAVRSRIDGDADGVDAGVTSAAPGFEDRLAVDVTLRWTLDRDRNVVSVPGATFEEAVAASPSTVTTTVSLDGHDYSDDVPVVVRELVVHYA